MPRHRRERLHRRAPGAAARDRRVIRCAASCARAATPRCSSASASRSPSATSRASPRSLAPSRAAATCCTAARSYRTGRRRRRSAQTNVQGTRNLLEASAGASVRALRPLQHDRRLRPPGRRRRRGDAYGDAASQLVRADQAARRGRGPSRRSRALARRRDPAPGDRLRAGLARGRRRDRARDPRAATCCSSTAAARSRGFATSRT